MSLELETILIVEDDPGTRELQRRYLERAGYNVVTASKAEEALTQVSRGGVALALLDFRLPGGMTGLDVWAQIKDAGYNLPVIVVSGFSDETTIGEVLRAGIREFVVKSDEYLETLPDVAARVLKEAQEVGS